MTSPTTNRIVPPRPTDARTEASLRRVIERTARDRDLSGIVVRIDRDDDSFSWTAWGSETRIRSRGGAVVLVDQPTEQVPPPDIARVGQDRLPGRCER